MNNRMNDIIISGHNLELTQALKDAVQSKMAKLFEHEGHIIRLRVELEYNHTKSHEGEFVAKGHIEIRGKDMIASAKSNDLYSSLDCLVEKLDRMIRRRSRLRELKRKQVHAVDMEADLPKVSVA